MRGETEPGPVVANHHADHPGFSGVGAYLTALSMLFGRSTAGALASDLTGVAPGEHVVDIGCGPGTATRVAAARHATVSGVDPSSEMLRLAGWLTRGQLIDWQEGAAEAVPLDDDSAEVGWSLAAVHHWPDIASGLAEVRRVLKPGGRFVAIERHTRPGATGLASHGWTRDRAERFAEDCRSAGFTDVAVGRHRPGRMPVLSVLGRVDGDGAEPLER